jgi:cyclase
MSYRFHSLAIASVCSAICALGAVLLAEEHFAPKQSFSDGSLKVEYVQGNVYMIGGAGGNVVVQVGDETLVLVDTGMSEYSEQIRSVVQKLSRHPVGFMVNTTAEPDHTGGNAALSKGGVYMMTSANQQRNQAAIVSHLNLLSRLSDPGSKVNPDAWPTDTFETEVWRFSANGEAIILEHPKSAHSDSDATVFFRRSDVIATGDLFDMTRYPVIDSAHGGSLSGTLKTLNHISLEVAVPKQNEEAGTYIIPGHGRVCDRYDIAIYRDMLTIIRDRIQDLIKKGQTLDQVKAAKPTYDYDGEFGAESGPWTTNMFVEAVYRELSKPAK